MEEIAFKDISILALVAIFQWCEAVCAILVEGIMRNISNYFEFGPIVNEKMSFKDIHILNLVAICTAEQNCFFNFGRWHYAELFCVTFLNLGQWLRRCRLKCLYF